jgi:hypothetical protein
VTPEWVGGRILVRKNATGWGVSHLREDGGLYGLGWNRAKSHAIEEGKRYARERSAKLFVEIEL